MKFGTCNCADIEDGVAVPPRFARFVRPVLAVALFVCIAALGARPGRAACPEIAPFFVFGACKLEAVTRAKTAPGVGSVQPAAAGLNWLAYASHDGQARYIRIASTALHPPTKGASPPAQLAIRCLGNETSAFFRFPERKMGASGIRREIVYRLDGGDEKIIELERAKDHAILGVWQGYRAVPFIRELMGGESLHISAIADDGTELRAQFDIHGMTRAIAQLRAACQW